MCVDQPLKTTSWGPYKNKKQACRKHEVCVTSKKQRTAPEGPLEGNMAHSLALHWQLFIAWLKSVSDSGCKYPLKIAGVWVVEYDNNDKHLPSSHLVTGTRWKCMGWWGLGSLKTDSQDKRGPWKTLHLAVFSKLFTTGDRNVMFRQGMLVTHETCEDNIMGMLPSAKYSLCLS